ncbi:MAG: hypothetical protein AAB639_03595 [Patescibacteria group bacterium]|mgnify:FL=1
MIKDAFAAECNGFLDCLRGVNVEKLKPEFTETNLIAQLVTQILPIILTIAGFVTVIVIIISGIQFVLSSGNPEAAAAAKNRLVYAIVGFIIIVLAFGVLQIVNRLFLGTTIA